MLTPQEIQDRKFEKAMFGGYDMRQIDDFLDVMLDDYTSLYKENATLKGKMRVLVDKIDEYRSVDEQMRKALYTAQVSARDIVIKAQTEADSMLSEARRTADLQISGLKHQVSLEEERLQSVKHECSDYANKIKMLLTKNIEVIEMIIEKKPESFEKTESEAEKREKSEFKLELPSEAMQPLVAPLDLSDTQEVMNDVKKAVDERFEQEERGYSVTQVDGQTNGDMNVTFFEVNLGEKGEKDEKSEKADARSGRRQRAAVESDTGKIYGESPFSPKPKFNFDNLKFGDNYDENDKDDMDEE